MKGLLFVGLLVLALSVAASLKAPQLNKRHHARPNQAVWESVAKNMERKREKLLAKEPKHEVVPEKPMEQTIAAIANMHSKAPTTEGHKTREAALHGLKVSRRRPGKFIQYRGGKAPVGRKQQALSSVKSKSNAKQKESMEVRRNRFKKQMAELKAKLKAKEDAAFEAKAEQNTGTAAGGLLLNRAGRHPWDKIWRPETAGEAKDKESRVQKDEQKVAVADNNAPAQKTGSDDPFASLNVNFAAAEMSEQMKQEREDREPAKKKAATDAAAQELEAQREEVQESRKILAEKQGEAPASKKDSASTPNQQDANAGVSEMEKDATQMLVAAHQEAQDEAKALGDLSRQTKKEIYEGAAKSMAAAEEASTVTVASHKVAAWDTVKVPVESMAEAVNDYADAQAKAEFDDAAKKMGQVWGVKQSPAGQSDVAAEEKRDADVAELKKEELNDIADKEADAAFSNLDEAWNRRPFDGGNTPLADQQKEEAPKQAAPAAKKRPTSDWGILSAELSTEGLSAVN